MNPYPVPISVLDMFMTQDLLVDKRTSIFGLCLPVP